MKVRLSSTQSLIAENLISYDEVRNLIKEFRRRFVHEPTILWMSPGAVNKLRAEARKEDIPPMTMETYMGLEMIVSGNLANNAWEVGYEMDVINEEES